MNININLLPKPKPKIRQVPLILLLGILTFLAGAYYLYYDYQQAMATKHSIEQSIEQVKKQKEQLSQELTKMNQESSDQPDISLYLQLPESIKKSTVKADFLLDQLARTLPEGGVIDSVEYKQPDQVKVSGKFATVEEIVAFLQAVKKNPVFRIEKIGSVGEAKREASSGLLNEDEKAASVYTMSIEVTMLRNTP